MSFIETHDIWQRRGERDILKNINLRIERGEVHALIGSTGAGKTTLLRLIDLLDTPSAGKIIIDGTDTAQSERARIELRRRMAFVLQKPVVFNTSVFENIAYGLKWRGTDRHRIRERVEELLEMVDLVSYRNRNARTLSGGEMQRVAVARAIATGPEVLLLDESTANLDPLSSAKIQEVIRRIVQQHAITVVMSTHDMPQGQQLADKISVLDDGEILQTDVPQAIFSRPVSRHVAEFVGMENIIPGVIVSNEGELAAIDIQGTSIQAVADLGVGEAVSVCMRPEDVTVALKQLSSSARNSLSGKVAWTIFTGPLCRVEIDCGFPLMALVTRRSAEEMGLRKGTEVFATFKAVSIHVIKRN
ncbi:MAG: ABC transporter ATP-binding protein [Dehalococcoidales bacterium]|nr:ABC transporter ATP-binding protein [Dehalococcoidales bacterium]